MELESRLTIWAERGIFWIFIFTHMHEPLAGKPIFTGEPDFPPPILESGRRGL